MSRVVGVGVEGSAMSPLICVKGLSGLQSEIADGARTWVCAGAWVCVCFKLCSASECWDRVVE